MSTYVHHLDDLNHHPDQLIRHVLRTYLLGLTKCCLIVADELSKGHMRENEDMNSDALTMDLYEDIDVSQTLDQLDLAHAILNGWPNEMGGYRIPLMERIRFRIEFLYSLALLSCSPSASTMPRLQNHLTSAAEALECIRLEHKSDKPLSFFDQTERVRTAFNLHFNQNVSSNSPPRPVQFPKSFRDLIDSAKRVIEELQLVSQIGSSSSVSDWMSFFKAFSRRDPTALPFIRSYLLSLFQVENVIALNQNQTLIWLARECVFNLSSGRIRLESDGVEIRYILNRLAGLIVNHLSAFAANRARGRRLLLNSLDEWKSLYNATAVNRLDISHSILQALQTLIYYMSIDSSLQAVLMGFDLDLYDEDEDRVGMWWVVERLSERACRLLSILSGGAESLEERVVYIIGKLAGVASQIVRQRNPNLSLDPKPSRQAVFQRRIKYFTSSRSSFEDTTLAVELDLFAGPPLLDYQSMVDSTSLDAHELDCILETAKRELMKITHQVDRHYHVQLGQNEFRLFIKCLMNAAEILMQKNRYQELGSTLEKLEISNDHHPPSTSDEQIEPNRSPGWKGSYADRATKWFIV